MTPREEAFEQVLDLIRVRREEAGHDLRRASSDLGKESARGRLSELRALDSEIRRLRKEQP